MKANFNEYMDFNVVGDILTLKSLLPHGMEFSCKINFIEEKRASFEILWVRDNGSYIKENYSRTYREPKFTEKWRAWIASILWNCKNEGII